MINFDALRGDTTPTAIVPADGPHTARLERISIWEGDRGEQLITEWSDEHGVQWTSWNRFDATGMSFTQDLLDGLGIDRSKLTDDNLTDTLEQCVGRTYQVRTQSKQGNRGDKWFTNTYVDSAQQTLPVQPDVPVDTRDFEKATAAPGGGDAGGLFDDDIPF